MGVFVIKIDDISGYKVGDLVMDYTKVSNYEKGYS